MSLLTMWYIRIHFLHCQMCASLSQSPLILVKIPLYPTLSCVVNVPNDLISPHQGSRNFIRTKVLLHCAIYLTGALMKMCCPYWSEYILWCTHVTGRGTCSCCGRGQCGYWMEIENEREKGGHCRCEALP